MRKTITGTGGMLLVQTLKDAGVEYLFTNPGSAETGIFAALSEDQDQKLIVGKHEGLVAAMADGYHRTSGKVGVIGAAVVVVPGALMARGATSRLSSVSPVVSAVSMLGWGFVKMALSVAMLVLAARIVPGVVWPALLASMVLCMLSYWFALLWRVPAAAETTKR